MAAAAVAFVEPEPCAAVVRPGAVVGFETLQTLHHAQSIRQLAAKVLVCSRRQETGVNCPVHLVRLKIEAAIARAKLFDPLNDRAAGSFALQTGSRPDARKTTEMDEIQMLSIAKAPGVGANLFDRKLSLERNQSIDTKDCVVEISSAAAICEAAVSIELSKQKVAHQLGGISEDFRREASHLEHLQPQAHASFPPALFSASNSLHQPLISVSLKILPTTRRRRPFRFALSKSWRERIACSL